MSRRHYDSDSTSEYRSHRYRSSSVDRPSRSRSRSRQPSRSRSPLAARAPQPEAAPINRRPVTMDEVTDRRDRDRYVYKYDQNVRKLGDYRQFPDAFSTQLSQTELNLIQDLPNSLPLTPESIRMLVGLIASTNARVAQRRAQLRRLQSRVKHFANNMQKQLADWINAVDRARLEAEARRKGPVAARIKLTDSAVHEVTNDAGLGVSHNDLKVIRPNVGPSSVYFCQSAYNPFPNSSSKSRFNKQPASLYSADAAPLGHPGAFRPAAPTDYVTTPNPFWTYRGGSAQTTTGCMVLKGRNNDPNYVSMGDLFLRDDAWKNNQYPQNIPAQTFNNLVWVRRDYVAPGQLATTSGQDHLWNDAGSGASLNLFAHRIVPRDSSGVDCGGLFYTHEGDLKKAQELANSLGGVFVLRADKFQGTGIPDRPVAPAGPPPAPVAPAKAPAPAAPAPAKAPAPAPAPAK